MGCWSCWDAWHNPGHPWKPGTGGNPDRSDAYDCLVESCRSAGVAFYCLGDKDAHTRCLATVVKAGADVTSTRHDGQPVLLEACESAKVEQCLLLLQHGANPSSKHAVRDRNKWSK